MCLYSCNILLIIVNNTNLRLVLICERRTKTEKYFEDLKKFKNSLSEVGLPAEIEVEVLKTYAIEKTKIMVKVEDNKEVLNQLKDLSDLTEIFK